MREKLKLQGLRVGRLTVVSEHGRSNDKRVLWDCLCDCGKTAVVASTHLKRGDTKSCGCLRQEAANARRTHGMSRTPEYESWCGMFKRCRNEKSTGYSDYGGRGITVCERWNRFENFIEDMGPRPSPLHSIDRKEVNGNYEPDNCKWATPTEQSRNTRKRKDGANAVVGVSWSKAAKKYAAYIGVDGKVIHIGVFASVEVAAKARRLAEVKYWEKEKSCIK